MKVLTDNHVQSVNIITTGGTIEKSYDELDGTLENRTSIIRDQVIRHLRLPYTTVEFHPLFAKDSLFMTEDDRKVLCAKVQELLVLATPIVVLHGTDTMDQSARYCFEQLGAVPVPVIFTGAMRPIGFDNSDARQNVTEALFASRLIAPGFYISFHGRLFTVPNVRKNRDKGTFEEAQG